MGFTLGVYEKAMPNAISMKEKLIAAKAAGYDFLELSIDETDEKLERLHMGRAARNEFMRTVRDVELPIGSICLSGQRRYPMGSSDPAIEKKSVEILLKAIMLAGDLGVRIIQLAGYDVYYEDSTLRTKEQFIENLSYCTRKAAAEGVILGLETMENDFMNTIEKAMYYVKTIGSPYLQVYPDIGNVWNGTDHVTSDIRSGKGHIVAAHLKETAPGIFRDMEYGEGQVDFKLAGKLLQEMGVTRFNAEFWYNGQENWKERLISSKNKLLKALT